MGSMTEFYRSQIGGASVINYSYTDFPWKLLVEDFRYFFIYSWALPWIIWPLFKYGSSELDELYPTRKNMFCVFVHLILIFYQLAFLLALPFTIVLPLGAVVLGMLGFLLFNWLLCRLINGKEAVYHSDEKYAIHLPEHAHEQWVFVNGVAVGEHWLRSNLNRLAITFKRPILGIHNQTSGIIFDIIECLIQRNFSYATYDVRVTYKLLKEVLYNPEKTKVILILHSQGGIEGGLVLDWLLQELPQDLLSKLEVYTFGNAANHFNNPHRRVFSESLAQKRPLTAITTHMSMMTSAVTTSSPIEVTHGLSVKTSLPFPKESSSMTSLSHTYSAAQDRAVGHIEHYAHITDFVALWGVLHFATNKTDSPQIPRFLGRLFARKTGTRGHQFNQHYLNGMFPLKRDPKTNEFVGADEDNDFMDEVAKMGGEGAAMKSIREAFNTTYTGTQGFVSGAISSAVEVHGVVERKKNKPDVKVKDLSRLWGYRNGKVPQSSPTLFATDGGVVMNAAM